jgi:hypothetical protein
MGAIHLHNAQILAGTHDLTGETNSVTLTSEVAEIDTTTFGSKGNVERIGGLKDFTLQAEGFTGGKQEFDGLGNERYVTISPTNDLGGVAYICPMRTFSYSEGGNIGEAHTFQIAGSGSSRALGLVRGTTLIPNGSYATTGTGTELQLGAVPSGKVMVVVTHVTGVDGTTPDLGLKVQSSTTSGFSSPTDRYTLDNATEGATVGLIGPVAHTWWRATWAISGTTPEFKMTMAVAIV